MLSRVSKAAVNNSLLDCDIPASYLHILYCILCRNWEISFPLNYFFYNFCVNYPFATKFTQKELASIEITLAIVLYRTTGGVANSSNKLARRITIYFH